MNMEDMKLGGLFKIEEAFDKKQVEKAAHPMLGRRCLIRTYFSGVHIGDIVFVEGTEVQLENALRLWSWEGGGLSLSAIANNGVKGGRLNQTGEIYLTDAIEMIPITDKAWPTFLRFLEDVETN